MCLISVAYNWVLSNRDLFQTLDLFHIYYTTSGVHLTKRKYNGPEVSALQLRMAKQTLRTIEETSWDMTRGEIQRQPHVERRALSRVCQKSSLLAASSLTHT